MKYGRVTEKQVKEIERRVDYRRKFGVCEGVRGVLGLPAMEWVNNILPPRKYDPFCWTLTPAGDLARKRFIRSLKGKRYPKSI